MLWCVGVQRAHLYTCQTRPASRRCTDQDRPPRSCLLVSDYLGIYCPAALLPTTSLLWVKFILADVWEDTCVVSGYMMVGLGTEAAPAAAVKRLFTGGGFHSLLWPKVTTFFKVKERLFTVEDWHSLLCPKPTTFLRLQRDYSQLVADTVCCIQNGVQKKNARLIFHCA